MPTFRSKAFLPVLVSLLLVPSLAAQDGPPVSAPTATAIEQLRHAAGTWDVTTKFLAPDGSVARAVGGSYTFDWVVPDRVLIGRSLQPELGQASGLLNYYEESTYTLEMASVGADGHLWFMTGDGDEEVRTTPPTPRPNGSTIQLRFTRFNVEADRFESKMEISADGGES